MADHPTSTPVAAAKPSSLSPDLSRLEAAAARLDAALKPEGGPGQRDPRADPVARLAAPRDEAWRACCATLHAADMSVPPLASEPDIDALWRAVRTLRRRDPDRARRLRHAGCLLASVAAVCALADLRRDLRTS